MAIINAVGHPVTDGEKRLIRELKKLPDSYIVYHNFELVSSSGQNYEYDVMVIAPHAIYIIEDKFWHGKITGNDHHCQFNDGKFIKNPVVQAKRLAQILHNYLNSRGRLIGNIWIQDIVHLSGDNIEINIDGQSGRKFVTLENVARMLLDPRKLTCDWSPRPCNNFMSDLERAFAHLRPKSKSKRRLGDYRLSETREQTELYKEYIGYNDYLGESSRQVLIREFFVDPYLSSRDQERQMLLLKRDFKALETLGSHPQLIRPRHGFEPDGDKNRFVVVYDSPPGTPLIEIFLSNNKLDHKKIRQLLVSALQALDAVHSSNILHRNINPNTVLIDKSNVVYLQNFEYSRLPLSSELTITPQVQIENLPRRYLAPIVQMDLSSACIGTDLFSLGVIFYDLLTGDDQTEWERKNALLPDLSIEDRELVQVVRCLSSTNNIHWYESAREPLDILSPTVSSLSDGCIKDVYNKGDRIDDRYLVEEKLGTGGSSNVYKVFYEPSEEIYAIKVMKHQQGNIQAVRREYRRLRELSHPHIARVFDVDSVGSGSQYLLRMEYIEGQSLEVMMREEEFSVNQVITWAQQLLDALFYLQQQEPPIIHSDIKPANVMIRDGKVVLIDFNISHTADDQQTIGGTRRYMAPDAMDNPNDCSNDNFSLGVLLFELLCGKYPFIGSTPASREIPLSIKDLRPSLSDELAAWIERACGTSKETRFTTIEEMKKALEFVGNYLKPQKINITTNILEQLPAFGEEVTKQYKNPFVAYYQSLYSQSKVGNRGTRGLDLFSKINYVETLLDRKLKPAILSGRHRLVIITGNAGDGKTAFIQRLEEEAKQDCNCKFERRGNNGNIFTINGFQVTTNYDGSQDEGDIENDQVLEQFFLPFKGNNPFKEIDNKEVKIIAINEGRLLEFLTEHKEFDGLLKLINNYLERQKKDLSELILVNLNWRSVVAQAEGRPSIVEQLLNAFTRSEVVEPCTRCDFHTKCYVYHNICTIRDETLGIQVKERIRRVIELVHMRRRLHITIRDIRSALAYIIFGNVSCLEIQELHKRSEYLEQYFAFLAGYYYNALFNWHPITPSNDRLMVQLGQIDVAEVAVPEVDRRLSMINATDQKLYREPDLAGHYDREVLDTLYDQRPREVVHVDNPNLVRAFKEFIRISKRKHFVETLEDDFDQLLPYSTAGEFLEIIKGKARLDQVKSFLVQAISDTEQVCLSFAQKNICLRGNKQKGVKTLSVRLFPARDFELYIKQIGREGEYVEHFPDCIELRYKTLERIRFTVSLDLFELLKRVRQGYVPTAYELRGAFINLTIFKNQLTGLPCNELLISSDNERFYHLMKNNGVISLNPVTEVQ